MNLDEAAQHCEKAWSQFAKKHKIHRDDEFYFFKMQEELGELTRAFMELRGAEQKSTRSPDELKKKFASDAASLVGNALILALHFNVDLEATIKTKFPVSE